MKVADDGPTFTASEVQAALRAVILYERARGARLLREAVATIESARRSYERCE